jgi:hypothetical protein
MPVTNLDTPITISRIHQPSSSETWEIATYEPVVYEPGSGTFVKCLAEGGWLRVTGRVLDRRVTSRLFSASNTQHTPEAPLDDYLDPRHLVEGARYITVAM